MSPLRPLTLCRLRQLDRHLQSIDLHLAVLRKHRAHPAVVWMVATSRARIRDDLFRLATLRLTTRLPPGEA